MPSSTTAQRDQPNMTVQELGQVITDILTRDTRNPLAVELKPDPEQLDEAHLCLQGVTVWLYPVRAYGSTLRLSLRGVTLATYRRLANGAFDVLKIAKAVREALTNEVQAQNDRAEWMTRFLDTFRAAGHALVRFDADAIWDMNSRQIYPKHLLESQERDPVLAFRHNSIVWLTGRWDETSTDATTSWFDDTRDFGYRICVSPGKNSPITSPAASIEVCIRKGLADWFKDHFRALKQEPDKDLYSWYLPLNELQDPVQTANHILAQHRRLMAMMLDLHRCYTAQQNARQTSEDLTQKIKEQHQIPDYCTVMAVPRSEASRYPGKVGFKLRLCHYLTPEQTTGFIAGIEQLQRELGIDPLPVKISSDDTDLYG